MSAQPKPLFCYGTLRDEPLLLAVLGVEGRGGSVRLEPAFAPGRRAAAHPSGAYPLLAEAKKARLEGVLLHGLSAAGLERLIAYEGEEYRLKAIAVETPGSGTGRAQAFLPAAPPPASAPDWRYEDWSAEDRKLRRAAAAELGALYDAEARRAGGRPSPSALAALTDLWPDCLGAAAIKLAQPGPIRRALGPAFSREAVEELSRERVYEDYFKLDSLTLRHRMFADPEGLGEPLRRAVFRMGDAVCLLPYDPLSDRVLLIEQFRPGPWIAGDDRPWSIEVIAGRIDAPTTVGGDPEEETARREAMEEAGLTLGRLERIGFGYASPGATDETLALFVGEARLAPPDGEATSGLVPGGAHGLASEGEDIRVFTLGLEEALEALAADEIRNTPAALALLWLARRRPRLRALWAGRSPLD